MFLGCLFILFQFFFFVKYDISILSQLECSYYGSLFSFARKVYNLPLITSFDTLSSLSFLLNFLGWMKLFQGQACGGPGFYSSIPFIHLEDNDRSDPEEDYEEDRPTDDESSDAQGIFIES